MQKKKLFTILTAILAISLIGLSATCLASGEAPTLKLEIYDGPDYSESDNMCYYRVEAIVTGMPAPEIEFDGDDNVDPLGSGRVEVGVEIGDSYTLTTTAKNSAGTATVSITLKGDCGEDVPDEETAEEDADTGTNGDTDADGADGDSDGDSDAEKEVPTISLEIYEGPFPVESICVYRVKAIVTGSPNPAVIFSKDDSGGAWGTKKAQVNINNPGDTYTLTATATNSEGSDTATIDLSWGCEEPEPEVTEVEVTLDVEFIGLGFINDGGYGPNFMRPAACMGDNVVNKLIKGYLTFNISDLSALGDINIEEVEINIPEVVIQNMPWEAASELHVKVFYYGNSLNYPEDFAVGGEHVKTFGTSDSITDLNFSSAKLKEELQKAVDINRELFQLKFGLNGISNNDSRDCYCFYTDNTTMYVRYEIVD